jgi:hypothetical protein
MNTYTIKVTKEDIKEGKRRDCKGCPIARAVKRATKLRYIQVGATIVFRNYPDYKKLSRLPKFAQCWIDDFDANGRKAVKPLKFRLKLP